MKLLSYFAMSIAALATVPYAGPYPRTMHGMQPKLGILTVLAAGTSTPADSSKPLEWYLMLPPRSPSGPGSRKGPFDTQSACEKELEFYIRQYPKNLPSRFLPICLPYRTPAGS